MWCVFSESVANTVPKHSNGKNNTEVCTYRLRDAANSCDRSMHRRPGLRIYKRQNVSKNNKFRARTYTPDEKAWVRVCGSEREREGEGENPYLKPDLTATARQLSFTDLYHTILYHIIPYHTIPYHTISYHTMVIAAVDVTTLPYNRKQIVHNLPLKPVDTFLIKWARFS